MTFDLDAAARDWRSTLQHRGTLSPRELDELEDHLRARIELERQLDPALAADRALAMATDDLGDTAALAAAVGGWLGDVRGFVFSAGSSS